MLKYEKIFAGIKKGCIFAANKNNKDMKTMTIQKCDKKTAIVIAEKKVADTKENHRKIWDINHNENLNYFINIL